MKTRRMQKNRTLPRKPARNGRSSTKLHATERASSNKTIEVPAESAKAMVQRSPSGENL